MSVITNVPEPNIWEEICKEFALKNNPPKEDDEISVTTEKEDFDAAKVNPVFYGMMYSKIENVDIDPSADFDPAISHPSCVGYAFLPKPSGTPTPRPSTPPPYKSCSPREYLEAYIFPVLLPALEEMLHQAKLEKCFERKRTKFNALDFLTEYLYKRNPHKENREEIVLEEIPFVKEWLKDHPRPPLPKSLLWSEEEATLIIQSFWRGYKVRRQEEVQELRAWQREWREENGNIKNKVEDFWARQMPDGEDVSNSVISEHPTEDSTREKNTQQSQAEQSSDKQGSTENHSEGST